MNLLSLYRIKCLPKNSNGRLAIPALAGLLVYLFTACTFYFLAFFFILIIAYNLAIAAMQHQINHSELWNLRY